MNHISRWENTFCLKYHFLKCIYIVMFGVKKISLYQKRVRYNKFGGVFEKVLPHSPGELLEVIPSLFLGELLMTMSPRATIDISDTTARV